MQYLLQKKKKNRFPGSRILGNEEAFHANVLLRAGTCKIAGACANRLQ